jgi:hypothetical protein
LCWGIFVGRNPAENPACAGQSEVNPMKGAPGYSIIKPEITRIIPLMPFLIVNNPPQKCKKNPVAGTIS